MKLYFFQFINASSVVIRTFLILYFGSSSSLGIYSLCVSSILLFSFIPQLIVNNQGLQFELMKMNLIDQEEILKAFGVIMFIVNFSLLLFFYFFENLVQIDNINQNLVLLSIFGACFVSIIISIFDFKAISNNKLGILYLTNATNSFSSVLFAFVVLFFFKKEKIIFLPLLSTIFPLLIYLFYYRFNLRFILFFYFKKTYLKKAFSLLRSTWIISLVPIVNNLIDYLLKFAISKISGFSILGYFQTIVSIESLTGNILLGPLNRKILFSYSTKSTNEYSTSVIVKKCIILSCIPIFFLVSLYPVNYFYLIPNKYYSILSLMIYILSIRIIWNFWGAIGQILVSRRRYNFVSFVEISNKFLIASIFIIFLNFSDFGIWSYLISLCLTACFLISVLYYIKSNNLINNEK
ncbi:hypothetical protein [Flavobacterium sp.]|uniref:hypothetical protein n=1 Tax=Flavobacterium sp. TaxID=239 RepID=UPI0022CAB662|nr:hypothetical protein [Flavobacterium sp.]MCZ8230042.1 hypothetical protein [Flavobacterium sp.]